ncbi:MAG: Gfo/Idh/MocA family oxidoreductase [Lachnospiraceae bacterium]|nr:Gfo/Idh/MocA family oxidoreductase [Lachnospiraceae bacterium]
MKKVITYGTYDLLHYGHIRLLERAKALGDYLIVGITTEDFDKRRGKINVKQSLAERIEAVKNTGLADEIIIEEYEGQKIDDIKRYGIDVFTVGTDWKGHFDYLKDYCEVVYLERTEGVSSSEARAERRKVRLGYIGDNRVIEKYRSESAFVNGIEQAGVFTEDPRFAENLEKGGTPVCSELEELLNDCEAVYIESHPSKHYEHVSMALKAGKHVLCESPISLSLKQYKELEDLAEQKHLVLMDSLKTAYATAYNRLLLLVKSGEIGDVLSVDSTCTSLYEINNNEPDARYSWNSICAWGILAMLPVFQILGTDYESKDMVSLMSDSIENYDLFSKIDFRFKDAVATVKAGKGVKSEGELIISGTKGYVYVPAPWWKTDYFEVRYEDIEQNKRYFYQLEGEGIRYELVAFANAVEKGKSDTSYIERNITEEIIKVVEDFYDNKHECIKK